MIRLFQVPYDSGHRSVRMGCGPEHFVKHGAAERLQLAGHEVHTAVVEPTATWRAEIGTAFELHRALAGAVREAVRADDFPLVLSGNCNSAVGVIAGLPENTGIIWFDAHGDFATPDTTESGFLDGMGLAIVTGRCFTRLAQTIPGFAPVPDEHVLTVGMRALDPAEVEGFAASEIARVSVAQVREGGLAEQLDVLRAKVGQVYVHVDLDVIDPSVAPANYAAAKGGLYPEELTRSLCAIREQFTVLAATLASYDPAGDPDAELLEVGFEVMQALNGGVGDGR
jgi:arginase